MNIQDRITQLAKLDLKGTFSAFDRHKTIEGIVPLYIYDDGFEYVEPSKLYRKGAALTEIVGLEIDAGNIHPSVREEIIRKNGEVECQQHYILDFGRGWKYGFILPSINYFKHKGSESNLRVVV